MKPESELVTQIYWVLGAPPAWEKAVLIHKELVKVQTSNRSNMEKVFFYSHEDKGCQIHRTQLILASVQSCLFKMNPHLISLVSNSTN